MTERTEPAAYVDPRSAGERIADLIVGAAERRMFVSFREHDSGDGITVSIDTRLADYEEHITSASLALTSRENAIEWALRRILRAIEQTREENRGY
jgi:hypothetical protein